MSEAIQKKLNLQLSVSECSSLEPVGLPEHIWLSFTIMGQKWSSLKIINHTENCRLLFPPFFSKLELTRRNLCTGVLKKEKEENICLLR